jgi:hypothetical protein
MLNHIVPVMSKIQALEYLLLQIEKNSKNVFKICRCLKATCESDQANYHSINIRFSTSKLSWYSVYNIKVLVFLGFWYNNSIVY